MDKTIERQSAVMDFVNRTVIGYSDVKSCHLSTATNNGFSELWDFCVKGLYEDVVVTSRITGEIKKFSTLRELAEWAAQKDFNGMSISFV